MLNRRPLHTILAGPDEPGFFKILIVAACQVDHPAVRSGTISITANILMSLVIDKFGCSAWGETQALTLGRIAGAAWMVAGIALIWYFESCRASPPVKHLLGSCSGPRCLLPVFPGVIARLHLMPVTS